MADVKLFERDPYAPIQYVYEIDEVLCKGNSGLQEYSVVTNPFFGSMLILDGVVQLTERDEYVYHEMGVHVPLHALDAPKRVIIIGGGDGGMIREVVKHPSVEKAWLVDIDPEVTRLSRQYFPSVASGLDDPRVETLFMDGAKFLHEFDGTADTVIVDSTDIMGVALPLFTDEFLKDVNRVIGDTGIYVTLSESLHFHFGMVREIQKKIRRFFKVADIYTAPIATYAGNWWSYSVGTNGPQVRNPVRPAIIPTRLYCPEFHKGAFLPNFLYDRLMEEGREGF